MPESPIGKSVSRVEGRLKVTGRATYAADNHAVGLAHGYLVVSATANATIQAMDTLAAESSPGVIAVYTPFNPLTIRSVPGPFGPTVPPLQSTEVGYCGQPIGFVVAETFEQARDAAMLIAVAYDSRPPALSLAGDQGPATLIPSPEEPGVVTILADGVESIEAALRDSEVMVTGTYATTPQGHAAMEPHAAVVVVNGDQLTIYSGTQGAGNIPLFMAAALGVDPTKVRAVNPFVGGSFGGKLIPQSETQLAAAAALALGRSIKVVLTREQCFTTAGIRSSTLQTLALGAAADGTLSAIKHDSWSSAAVGQVYAELTSHRTSRYWYASSNLQISQSYVPLNIPPGTIMRAPGEAPGSFALETAMDELAVALDRDPIELRLKNYATTFPGRSQPWSSKHLDECYRLGSELFGWSERLAAPRSVLDGEWYVGMGMATAAYPAFRFAATMKVRLQPDGTVAVSGDTADLGTGMLTVLAIVAADALGVPLENIQPSLGDSKLSPTGGVGGSAGTASVGPAIMAAAELVKTALIELALGDPRSPFYRMSVDSVAYVSGSLVASGLTMDFGPLLVAIGSAGIEAAGSAAPGADASRFAFTSFGAQYCEVRVNKWTGEPRVSRMLSVMDAGRIINLQAARSQIVGGMIWGVSAALHEGLRTDDAGRIVNANFADYLVPVNADIPVVDVHFLDYPDTAHNPLGARGIGELGIVGMAAAVGNAVFNATGKRVRELPITLEQLFD